MVLRLYGVEWHWRSFICIELTFLGFSRQYFDFPIYRPNKIERRKVEIRKVEMATFGFHSIYKDNTWYFIIGLFFYSPIFLWLITTLNMFKSWTINMFKIDKKRNGWRTIFKRNFLVHWFFFNKVKLILH